MLAVLVCLFSRPLLLALFRTNIGQNGRRGRFSGAAKPSSRGRGRPRKVLSVVKAAKISSPIRQHVSPPPATTVFATRKRPSKSPSDSTIETPANDSRAASPAITVHSGSSDAVDLRSIAPVFKRSKPEKASVCVSLQSLSRIEP